LPPPGIQPSQPILGAGTDTACMTTIGRPQVCPPPAAGAAPGVTVPGFGADPVVDHVAGYVHRTWTVLQTVEGAAQRKDRPEGGTTHQTQCRGNPLRCRLESTCLLVDASGSGPDATQLVGATAGRSPHQERAAVNLARVARR
jgi:hypothetical protein